MDSIVQKSVKEQRKHLSKLIGGLLSDLASDLVPYMDKHERLNDFLTLAKKSLPYCKYIYVLDKNGIQLSYTVKHEGENKQDLGRDRSERPYLVNLFTARNGIDFELSSAYISKNKKRPSLTAVQIIRNEVGERLGFLGVDYDLRELPRNDKIYEEPRKWRQIKGDPAIRGGLFLQSRSESEMDKRLEEVMTILEELMTEHGVYHCQIHYSSSRVTVWHVDDPYTYRILTMDELSNSEVCLAYPKRPYFERNIVPKPDVCNTFKQFFALRFADDTVYLRSGSLNLVNGFVGLNFSCDGTHYLTFDDFLEKGLEFWFGANDELNGIESSVVESTFVEDDVEGHVDQLEMDKLIEEIALRGCLEVNQIVMKLASNKPPKFLAELKDEELLYVHDELKSVMDVYEGEVCSI